MAGHHETEQSNLKVGLAGLGIGLVWVFIVAAFSYWLAIH
jgi:hypothetical protein